MMEVVMRYTGLKLTIITVMTLAVAPLASAQMMGGHQGHMQMGQADTLSQTATTGMNMMGTTAGKDSLITGMSQYSLMMSRDFDKLQSSFDAMMQIKDMKTLKVEMQKYHEMMQQMRNQMIKLQDMHQNMMSMMHSGNVNETMPASKHDAAAAAGKTQGN